MRICVLLFSILVFATGCGYLKSGTWEDSPRNWSRAFDESRPADGIEVVRSWYMRTPHFTAEFAWFFQLKISATAQSLIIANPEIVELPNPDEEEIRRRMYSPAPKWFLPKPLKEFRVFRMGTGNFLLFFERNGDLSYWTAYQL